MGYALKSDHNDTTSPSPEGSPVDRLEWIRAIARRCSHSALAVAVEVQARWNPAHGCCWPSQGQIAAALGMSRHTVLRAVAELRQAGLLRVQHTVDGANRYSPIWVEAGGDDEKTITFPPVAPVRHPCAMDDTPHVASMEHPCGADATPPPAPVAQGVSHGCDSNSAKITQLRNSARTARARDAGAHAHAREDLTTASTTPQPQDDPDDPLTTNQADLLAADDPKPGMPAMPPMGTDEDLWRYGVGIEPWVRSIVGAGGKIGPRNWRVWKGLVDSFGIDRIVKALPVVDATERWPDKVEKSLKDLGERSVSLNEIVARRSRKIVL